METCVLIPAEFSLMLRQRDSFLQLVNGLKSIKSRQNAAEKKTETEAGVCVYSNQLVRKGTCFLPFQGTIRLDRLEVYSLLNDDDIRNKFGCFDEIRDIDNRTKVRHCNWIRFVTITKLLNENVNLVGRVVRGEVIYECIQSIAPNKEIVVFYDLKNFDTTLFQAFYPSLFAASPFFRAHHHAFICRQALQDSPLDLSMSLLASPAESTASSISSSSSSSLSSSFSSSSIGGVDPSPHLAHHFLHQNSHPHHPHHHHLLHPRNHQNHLRNQNQNANYAQRLPPFSAAAASLADACSTLDLSQKKMSIFDNVGNLCAAGTGNNNNSGRAKSVTKISPRIISRESVPTSPESMVTDLDTSSGSATSAAAASATATATAAAAAAAAAAMMKKLIDERTKDQNDHRHLHHRNHNNPDDEDDMADDDDQDDEDENDDDDRRDRSTTLDDEEDIDIEIDVVAQSKTNAVLKEIEAMKSLASHIVVKKPRERTMLPCEYCGKAFDRPSLLRRHLRTHTGEKPHVCDVCGKGFSTSSSLNTHRRIHSGEKPHQCPICGKRFTASSNLYYHRMTHNKVKPHACQLCSKSFPTPGDLKSHMYVHNGSWPFKCSICNRGFSKQTNLRNHMLLHSGDRPHECEICQKRFALQCNLRAHMKTHEEPQSEKCLRCGREYPLSTGLVTLGCCHECYITNQALPLLRSGK